jgi:F-type H+-transporting ATPase subunit 8
MSASLLRPLLRAPPAARAVQARFFAARSARALAPAAQSAAARKTQAAAPGKQLVKPEPASKMPSRVWNRPQAGAETVTDKAQTVLLAAMPQMVPFYFVNEVATTFGMLIVLIYLYSKYWLPQTVRTRLARLFVVKL